jgi:hypothetical protein
MPLHSRPIPAPKAPAYAAARAVTAPVVHPEPQPERPSTGIQPPAGEPRLEPSRASKSLAQPAVAEEASRPWYRKEPWLVATVAAFAPLLGAVIAPESARYPLISLSVLALVVGIVMLIRQGLFRPNTASRPHRE